MKIKCKTCARAYRIEPPFVEGQETLCPYCGATNVYHAPTRIELPTGAAARSRPSENATPSENAAPLGNATSPELQPVSRLHVIRPSGGAASAERSQKDNALVERVRARGRAEARRQLFRKIGVVFKDLFWILVLVALVLGGWRLFRAWKSPRQPFAETQPQASEKPVEELAPDRPVTPIETKPQPQARPAVAPSTLRSEDVLADIKTARVSFYGLLPPQERLGAVDGHFALVIPYAGQVTRIYGIASTASGVSGVIRCDAGKTSEPATQTEYEQELQRQGGFLIRSGVAYYVTQPSARKTWNPPLKSGEDFCASAAYFGNAHEIVRKQGWRTDNLRFDICLSFGEKEKPVPVATVKFGEKTYYSSFRKAAEPFARKIRAQNLRKPTLKAYRPTVVFPDGPLIGSNLNGITKVPRRAQHVQGPEYIRWRKLAEEAERQEREARRVQSENEAKMSEWKRQLEGSTSDEEIRKALMAATVKINRREEGVR